jgi:hypothetical protein
MEIEEYHAECKKYLSEIPIDSESTILDHAVYLELILNGPFVIWDEDGEYKVIQVKARVDTYRNLKIIINPKEHPPPHFHVQAENIDASFAIEDCSLLAGNVSAANLRKIRYWYTSSKPKLIEVWNSTRPTNCVVGEFRDKKQLFIRTRMKSYFC